MATQLAKCAFRFLSLVAAAIASMANATTINVTSVNDGSFSGVCTLRDAIKAANTNVAQVNCPAGSAAVADVINVPAGVYYLSNSGTYWDEDNNLKGDLDVRSAMTIQGASALTTVIVAPSRDRVFDVSPPASANQVTIQNMTLAGGNVLANSSRDGGTLLSNGAALNLRNMVIRGGNANYGGNLSLRSADGDQVKLENVSVLDGHADTSGGGIEIINSATSNAYEQVFYNVTISGNSSFYGGSSGIHLNGYLQLNNSTITDNRGRQGIGVGYGTAPLRIFNSIIQGNTNDRGYALDLVCPQAAYGTSFHSLIGTKDAGCVAQAEGAELDGMDAKLSPRFDFGAGIPVHALLPGSPALHAGESDSNAASHCLSRDARGVLRPSVSCDIGSYQAHYDASITSTADLPDAVPGDGVCATSGNKCTLRAVTMEAAASGGRWITYVPPGTYALNLPDGIYDQDGGDLDVFPAQGVPPLSFALIGQGDADDVQIVGSNDRVLEVHGLVSSDSNSPNSYRQLSFALINATLRGGHLTHDNFVYPGESPTYLYGGGLRIRSGRSLLYNTVIRDNIIEPQTGAYGESGGIDAYLSPDLIKAVDAGAQPQQLPFTGSVSLKRFSITSNQAMGDVCIAGGARFYPGNQNPDFPFEPMVLLNGTISGNESYDYGGLIAGGKSMRMAFVTISNNKATRTTGVVQADGVYFSGGQVANSVIAGNIGPGHQVDCATQSGSITLSLGYLLIGEDSEKSCVLGGDATGNLYDVDARLGPLETASNGVLVHPPLGDSPIIDAIPVESCTDADGLTVRFDARSMGRLGTDGATTTPSPCTMGAVESAANDLIFTNGFEAP